MSSIYTTIQGDTWDMIAKRAYDDESQIGLLLNNNFQYIDTWVFEAGCEIIIPDVEETAEEEEDLPDWREDEEDEDDVEEVVED